MKKIKKLAYIHDLGGIMTHDGLLIRHNLIYRSSHLSKINDDGLNCLVDNFKIKHIIDLRTDEETEQDPEDFVSKKAIYHHLAVLTNEENPAVNKINRLGILDDLVHLKGGVKAHMKSLYRTIVNSPKAQSAFKEVFKILLNNKDNEGVLFHCTQGKDRTGVLLFLILSALGVSQARAIAVYKSFNHRARFKRFAIFLGMNVAVSPRKAVALHNCLIARHMYIEAAIEEFDTKYDGVMNYLKNKIELSDEDIAKLRKQYLKRLGEK